MDTRVITEIQHALRTLSFSDPRLPPIAVDGIYGNQTANAVMIFQRIYDLAPTGEVDFTTWEQLKSVFEASKGIVPLPIDAFPHPVYILRPGETGEIVPLIQIMLIALSKRYSNIAPVSIGDLYTPETIRGIRQIQRMHELEDNGIVDAVTWNYLVSLYNERNAGSEG